MNLTKWSRLVCAIGAMLSIGSAVAAAYYLRPRSSASADEPACDPEVCAVAA